MATHSRRTFIMTAGAGLAVAARAGTAAAAKEPLRHAVIGVGGQGRNHARTFDAFPDCTVVALCDVDPKRRAQARGELAQPEGVAVHAAYERVLDDPEIDSVSIATADHWHTKIAMHALQAGKHVYVEKPCSHNIAEGVALGEFARHYGKCVQHGTHSRGSAGIQAAVAYLREEHLGKVRVAKAINHQFRGPIGRRPVEDPPPDVDYDRWLGPAPLHAYTRNRWHYNWHWFWDYGCGDIGNDGIHQIDQARWGLGVGMPRAVHGGGGQLYYDDDHETPDHQVITFDYDDHCLIYEMRLWTKYPMEGHDNGVVFYCDEGTVQIGRKGCFAHPIEGDAVRIGDGADFGANVRNFIGAAKADDPGMLMAPIEEGIVSAALCHMGNIVTRTGRSLRYDANTGRFDNDDANALRGRSYREGYQLPVIA